MADPFTLDQPSQAKSENGRAKVAANGERDTVSPVHQSRASVPCISPVHRFLISAIKVRLLAYGTVRATLVLMESGLVYPGAYLGDDADD